MPMTDPTLSAHLFNLAEFQHNLPSLFQSRTLSEMKISAKNVFSVRLARMPTVLHLVL